MTLLFHNTESSINTLLEEGIKSANILAKEGKIEPKQDSYQIVTENHKKWVAERKLALKENPVLLEKTLTENSLQHWLAKNAHARFYNPEHPGNRFNNVYFQYLEKPPSYINWVAIDVPDSTLLHDALCRDRQEPELWTQTACSIKDFQEFKSQGSVPYQWFGFYNEYLIRDSVPSERIIAYAKLEKELPFESNKATPNQLEQVQVYLNNKLSFATQFENPADNILISEKDSKYQIRISFNKDKVAEKENDVLSILQPIQSMSELIEKSREYKRIAEEQSLENSPQSSPRNPILNDQKAHEGVLHK
jgi:hypothetical protein